METFAMVLPAQIARLVSLRNASRFVRLGFGAGAANTQGCVGSTASAIENPGFLFF